MAFVNKKKTVQTGPEVMPPTERSLPVALIRAREHVMGPIRKMLSASGVTEQQWRILRVLAENGPMDSTTLADRACLLVPSLTRIAHSMAQRGLVAQTRDQEDRRRQIISITSKGQDVILAHRDTALGIANDIKRQLGQDNYDNLLDLLAMLDPGNDLGR